MWRALALGWLNVVRFNEGMDLKISGILLVDKQAGVSSTQVLHVARKLLGADKAGHAGTLDPLATGVLPVAFGEATKTCGHLLEADKAYRTRAQLGVVTETGDSEGKEVLATRPVPGLSAALIESVLANFRGDILQQPPMYSALKFQGTALYKLARRGVEIERPARKVRIHALNLLDFGADWIDLEITCGSGTYVRSLVQDIGEELGCGAHVSVLRRLWVAPFQEFPMYTLDDLGAMSPEQRREKLAPIDCGILHLPILHLDAEQAKRYLQAQRFSVEHAPGAVRVYGPDGILAIGEVGPNQLLQVQRMLAYVPQIPNPNRVKTPRSRKRALVEAAT
jgi:tRNA pseudouridine55 synthase